jgi:hypothetical protein
MWVGCYGASPTTITSVSGPGSELSPDETGASGNPAAPEVEKLEGAFQLPRDRVSLLPFPVRLLKVATVLGVPTTDPLLDGLRRNRIDLGDGDMANGVRPDRSWTAAKIGLWVKELRGVCGSPAMRARFTLPRDINQLVMTAHGRQAAMADSVDVTEAVAGITLNETERHVITCLAVLSSAEFVSR